MPQPSHIPLGTYNPAQLPMQVMLAEHTGRSELMEDLLSHLNGGSPQTQRASPHALLVGPSGFGKTMSLHVLKHRLEADPRLFKTWVPLLFDEENYHIGDLAGFWLECLRLAEAALGRTGEVTHEKLRTSEAASLEDQARKAFLALVHSSKRRALLLVDRLDEVLASVRDEDSQQRLRAFLRQKDQACVIATASAAFPEISTAERTFARLFRVFQLEGHTADEMKTAMQALGDARGGSSRFTHRPTRDGFWQGLHILTGGSPRLLKMTCQLLERGISADFQALLEGLLDACTPDIKQRIEAMSRQQRRVFDAIAHAWDSVQIAEISAGLRMESNQISAQIKALVDAGLIAVSGGSAKRKRYQVADRFSNLYCLMRFSRAGRSRLDWFIRTMNILLEPDPNAPHLEKLRELSPVRSGGDDGKLHAQLLAHALRDSDEGLLALDEGRKTARHLLKAESSGAANRQPDVFDMGDLFPVEYDVVRYAANLPAEQRSKLGYQHLCSPWWCVVAREAHKLHKSAIVEQCAKHAVQLDRKNADAWGMISAMLLQNKRAQEALDAAQTMLKVTQDEAQRELARTLILAARHLIPEHREEAERQALQMAMHSPGELFSILGFWHYLRCDVKACREVLPRVLTALSASGKSDNTLRTLAHFLALGISQTLLAADLDDELEEAIVAAGSEVTEALDTALQTVQIRRDENLRAFIAPERLALVDAYLAEVGKRKAAMQRSGAKGRIR